MQGVSATSLSDIASAAGVTRGAIYVVTLGAEALTITTDLPGRTSAFRIAEVRPQVGGIILKRNYTEGSYVEAGTSLYQIDPAICCFPG